MLTANLSQVGPRPRWPTPKPKPKPGLARPPFLGKSTMPSKLVMASDMAVAVGIDPKAFRQALRDANLTWHQEHDFWIVERGSPQHADMQKVLEAMLRARTDSDDGPHKQH